MTDSLKESKVQDLIDTAEDFNNLIKELNRMGVTVRARISESRGTKLVVSRVSETKTRVYHTQYD